MSDRILIDTATGELLFLERVGAHWRPALDAMDAWREARLRIYRLTPTLYATMPNLRLWPVIDTTEMLSVSHVIEHPWIPDGSAFELPMDIEPAELPAMDALYVEMTSGGGPPPQPPGGGAVAAAGAESRQPAAETSTPALAALLAAVAAAPDVAPAATVHVTHTHMHHWDLDALWRPSLLWAADPYATRPLASTATALAALSLLMAAPEPQNTAPPVAAMPKHVADLVLRDAEARAATCPITMEPIKIADAAVTSCGHVFQRTAIAEWLTTHTTCPQCRQACAL